MAAKYRKIDPRVWNDEKFASMTLEQKIMAFWMLTNSRLNRIGVVLWSPGLASEETGISRDRIDTVCHTVCHTLNWVIDKGSKTVFLTTWWKYNAPDNEKALQGQLEDLHDLPRHNLNAHIIKASEYLKPELRKLVYTVCHTVSDTVCDTVSPQKQKQKQEQKQEEDVSSEPPPATREHKGDGANANPKKTPAPKPAEPPDDSPIVLTFPVVGNPDVPTWDLRASQVEAWSKIFPGVNVTHECRKALGWIQVNPAKTKTTRGMPKFLYSWLERETNRGNVMPRSRQPALPMPISSYDTNTLNNSASEV